MQIHPTLTWVISNNGRFALESGTAHAGGRMCRALCPASGHDIRPHESVLPVTAGGSMATVLDKVLKRALAIDGQDYTLILDPQQMRLVPKGKRKAAVELAWKDLISGDAALSTALNASVSKLE
jgi:hypothetical protein